MAPSARSRTFALTFHPNGREEGGSSSSSSSPYPSQRVIPVNAFAPMDIENDQFKGRILLIHDTGNEIGLEVDEGDDVAEGDGLRKGVQLQIQGRFKRESTLGADTASGLYIGGEMMAPLKLGFMMRQVVNLATSYAKKKTEGRFYFVQGDANAKQKPQLAFPIAQLFTIISTPPGQDAPALGSEEIRKVKWQGASRIDVNTTSTYTFVYKTPYLDCCSWELLNVPGVSPLPLERILGEIVAACVVMYDLGVAGSHANWRKGAVLEWYFTRREAGEPWLEDDDRSVHTALEEASDASSESEAEDPHEEEDDDGVIIPAGDDDDEHSDDTESSDEPVEDDEDEISRAESQALVDLSAWQMRSTMDAVATEKMDIQVPFYIETIDRRRRRRLRVWYVFELLDVRQEESKTEAFTSKNIHELRSVCQPRPRLRAFRRRRGATRGCQCYGVQTLEQFRQVVRTQLGSDSKLRRAVITSATPETPMLEPPTPLFEDKSEKGASRQCSIEAPSSHDNTVEARKTDENMRPPEKLGMSPVADTPRISEKSGQKDSKAEEGANSNTLRKLASANEKEESTKNRVEDVKEKLEMLKNKAGNATETIKNKAGNATEAIKNKVRRRGGPVLPPPFFQRGASSACDLAFHSAKEGRHDVVHEGLAGAVHYEGRLCEELLRLSKDGILRCFMPYDCDKPRVRLRTSHIIKVDSIESLFLGRFYLWEVHTLLRVFVFCSHDAEDREGWIKALCPDESKRKPQQLPLSGDASDLLMDLSRGLRWRPTKRIVLNDRRLIQAKDLAQTGRPQTAEKILDIAFRFGEEPTSEEMIKFIDATCDLKGVSFKSWTQNELMAFWMNTYHCLLLHGRILLGTPKSRGELSRFYSRVSYLVGVKPVSLKEIEQHILRIPIADRVAVRYAGRARGRQLFYCLCCRKRGAPQGNGQVRTSNSSSSVLKGGESSPGKSGSPPRPSSPRAGSETAKQEEKKKGGDVESPPSSESDDGDRKHGKKKKNKWQKKCMPKPNVPNAHQFAAGFDQVKGKVKNIAGNFSRNRRGPSVGCFYIGEAPQPLGIPKQDMRAAFCLNRGNVSCLPAIPLFSDSHANSQIEEVCRHFCAEFVRVVEKDGVPTRAVLPHCCRGLKRDFSHDLEALLKFIWPFLPNSKERGQPTRKTHVAFTSFRREPRTRQDLKRYQFSKPELMVDAFRVEAGTMTRQQSEDVCIEVQDTGQVPRMTKPKPGLAERSHNTRVDPLIMSL